MKTATAPVLLMNADRPATTSINNTSRRVSLLPATASSQLPIAKATPVRNKPSPMTNSPAIRTTNGSPNPASASFGASRPLSIRASTARMATISIRSRSLTKSNMVTKSRPKTSRMSPVMNDCSEFLTSWSGTTAAYSVPSTSAVAPRLMRQLAMKAAGLAKKIASRRALRADSPFSPTASCRPPSVPDGYTASRSAQAGSAGPW